MSQFKYQKLRGMKDWLPQDSEYWLAITNVFIDVCKSAGLGRISTPIIENTELFSRAVGEQTEVVSKEMYIFNDRSDNRLALKPESTAGVVRAYIENGLASQPKPIELYYIEPHFRYERPQAGRYRQHHQLGVEIFGDSSASADVHAIKLAVRVLERLGIKYVLSINSIGNKEDRRKYIDVLRNYFEPFKSKLPELNRAQLEYNPLRILDTKDDNIKPLVEEAPHILDYLNKDSSARFAEILEMLEACGVNYELNSRLVRGFDYYNDVVFEFVSTREEARDSVGGGGRYDSLVEQMGGVATPAVGFGLGLERLRLELEAMDFPLTTPKVDVFVVAIGKEATNSAEVLREQLLDAGLKVRANFTKKSISDQLAIAAKQKATLSLIIGEREAKQGEVIVKDMSTGNQHSESLTGLIDKLRALLKA
jgi:histidyl-tRNA synthetase